MKLTIVTPFSHTVHDITWLELNTPAGNMIILQGHAPMIVTLSPHKKITYCLTNGKQDAYTIHRGIAHVDREATQLIIDSMEK